MNKKKIIILIIIFIIAISLLALIFIFIIKPNIFKTQNSKTANFTQTQNIKYTANFQITGDSPQELKVTLKNPPEKGIIGMQIYLKINPNMKSQIKIEDIIETLPKPWQYFKKEINENNEIFISAIFLQPGINGDLSKEYSIVKINLPSGNKLSEASLDLEKSKLYDKQSGLEISFDNRLYSK